MSTTIDTLSVFSNAKIGFGASLARAAQELSFNKLEIVLADDFQPGSDVDFSEILGDTVAISSLAADSIVVKNSAGGRVEGFDLVTDADGKITGISNVTVPEPALIAALFGLAVLGRAVLPRKRR